MLRKPELAFSVLALLFGITFLIITPPFQVPDEPAHFLRAFCITEAQLGPVCSVPADLVRFSNEFQSISFRADAKTSAALIVSSGTASMDSSLRTPMPYPGVTVLPIAHLTTAAGVGLARLAGGGPLSLFYSGRLTNLLLSTLIAALALHLTPFFKWTLLLVALTPMGVALRSSFSPDAIVISLALLVVASSLRVFDADAHSRKNWILLLASAAALVLIKPYCLLPLIVFASTRNRSAGMRAALIVVIATCLALSVASTNFLYKEPAWATQADPDRQWTNVRTSPVRFATVLVKDLLQHADNYGEQMIGRLGWLDTPLPRALIFGYALLLFGVAISDGRSFTWFQRWWFALLTVLSVGLIAATQYLYWTAPGADDVGGVQGRYFLPVLPLGLLALAGRFSKFGSLVGASSIAGAGVALLISVAVLLRRYYQW